MIETVIFLVIAGLALVFRWFTIATTRDSDEGNSDRREEWRRGPDGSEEERVRRFLEALGMPQGSTPPPPVRRQPLPLRRIVTPKPAETRRPRRRLLQPLPPLVTVPPETAPEPAQAAEESVPAALTSQIILPSSPVPETTPIPTRALRQPVGPEGTQRRAVQKGGVSPLTVLLRDRRSLQQAIILREILGPPRAFASLDANRGAI